MDRVLDKSVQRIIYLDSDLVVLGDLTELAAIELGGRTIGAVKDFLIKRCGNAAPAFRFDLGLASQPYFNAGVMLVDLEKWRRERIRERTLEFLRLNHSSIRWWDQDALNFMIAGDWLELDPRWNRQSAYWWLKGENAITGQDGLLNPHIVHFTGKDKPWRNYRHPDKRVYEHYLCLAGYADHRLSLFKAVALKIAEKLKLKWSF
jgi:lipopolysaccharide biosynthesis glycosyltransferase